MFYPTYWGCTSKSVGDFVQPASRHPDIDDMLGIGAFPQHLQPFFFNGQSTHMLHGAGILTFTPFL
jgi:hypothetical protein